MASRHNLKRIGEEGFRMLEQAEEKQRCLYHPTKPNVHYVQPPPVTQVHKVVTPPQINYSQHQIQKPPTTFYQTLQNPVTGSITSHLNFPRHSADNMTHVIPNATRDQASTGVMDCYEAARRFGGMVVTDYYPNNKVTLKRGVRLIN